GCAQPWRLLRCVTASSRSLCSVACADNAWSCRSQKALHLLKSRLRQWPLLFSVIAFSTCWNSGRHTDGDAMLQEIKTELGFDFIELGHGTRLSLVPGIPQKIGR